MKQPIKVLFASGSDSLIPAAVEHLRAIMPELPLAVVSEFSPGPDCRWIRYHVQRSLWANLALCRASLKDRQIRISAVILQPGVPFWRLRAIGFLMCPRNFLAFNENLGHFMLRPRSASTIMRHLRWRCRNFLVWELSPGGDVYTFLWRLAHPRALKRPLFALLARVSGWITAALKRLLPPLARVQETVALPAGVSVVVPSRNGKEFLARLLPEVVRQLDEMPGEAIIADNGSDDGTADFLRTAYPRVRVVASEKPLSFARAANAGIAAARFSHICLLNNDMVVENGFFRALIAAFARVPDLFCATAQIFLPEGARREETGKAAMPAPESLQIADFPVRCDLPIPGEDLTYVLYGSGGCSLFDAQKLKELGGFDPIYEPAYVEDLDLGVRGWQRGWPTVFTAGSRVLHQHRSTTSRYYSPQELERILERNYLLFLARTVRQPAVFRRMWTRAIRRLNVLAASQAEGSAAYRALTQAWQAPRSIRRPPRYKMSDEAVFAIGGGALAVFPGTAPRGKPVVLIASPYLPFPLSHGGAVRMYNLMRRAAADFDQVLVSFTSELQAVAPEILQICTEAITVKRLGSHARPSTSRPDVAEEFDSPVFHAALRLAVRKWKPAVAQLEFTQMAQYAADCAPAKTLLVEHDITLDLYQQLLGQQQDWEVRRQLDRWVKFEKAAWRTVDSVLTMSEKDRHMVQGGRAAVLPNGVDVERFQPCTHPPEPYRLLFIGSFAHLPNLLAVEFFLREVWPRLAPLPVKLHLIAGARHQYFLDRYRDRVQVDLALPGLEVEDFAADVLAYRRASVVIAPLLASAGTNIKILEAMAMSKAIVSTSGGVNGLDLDAGRDIVVENDPLRMAAAIRELLEDESKRRALETRARQTALARFNWDAIAEKQKQIYSELAAER